jgi:hypothetical protein
MIWHHHSTMRWFSDSIQPLTIEIRAFKGGGAAWRIMSGTYLYAQDKANHPMDAISIASERAREIADRINHKEKQ